MVVLLSQELFTRKLLGGKVVFEMVVVFGQELFTTKLQGGKVIFEMEVVFGQGLFTRKLLGRKKWSLKGRWCLVRGYLQGNYWGVGGMVFEMVVVLGQEFFTRRLQGNLQPLQTEPWPSSVLAAWRWTNCGSNVPLRSVSTRNDPSRWASCSHSSRQKWLWVKLTVLLLASIVSNGLFSC